MMEWQLAPRERTELIYLEEFVPQDHLLRAADRYLDLTDFRAHLKGVLADRNLTQNADFDCPSAAFKFCVGQLFAAHGVDH